MVVDLTNKPHRQVTRIVDALRTQKRLIIVLPCQHNVTLTDAEVRSARLLPLYVKTGPNGDRHDYISSEDKLGELWQAGPMFMQCPFCPDVPLPPAAQLTAEEAFRIASFGLEQPQ